MTARRNIPERVRALLTAPANVAIHGSPGSGKSWIGDRVKQLLDDTLQPVIRIDLSTTSSGKDVFVELLLGLNCAHDHSKSPSAAVRDVWRTLRSCLISSNQHFVFLLDQFDRVLKFDDALDFLLLFRELVHRPESLRCTALMISRRSLESIETKVSGISTLAGVCYTQYLGSLGVDDLEDLGPGTNGLTLAERVECLRWSGGHPVLAKYWLTTRPDVSPDPSGDMERAKIASRVLDHLADLRLLDVAAQYVLGPIVDDLLFERQELEMLGVVSVEGERTEGSISLAELHHFRDALRHRTWSMNPWGVLGNAEVRLRGLIDNTLSDAHGEDWAPKVAKKNKAVQTALSEALAKQSRDTKMFSRQAPLLSYTYPGDLWQIMQVEWNSFVPVFSTHDKPYWRNVLTGLSQYRAPLAHGRAEVLGEVQRTQCRLFAEEILTTISQYENSRLSTL
ncbi:ATP-binding protein [Cryobacterium sp. TMB1-7]|uniref:ATP-binding protein n=1 Tax=Cryobacterium sp. TMB1-7 TaxID=2555866 RepID=UPI00106C7592|nr:ATP-binding protein [Cryobacterium sp. TMB1-7]TFC63095.1 ATP-binding protein [Cryobacterium sp. TMB1-7]